MLAFLLFIIFLPKLSICGYGYAGGYEGTDGIPKPVMTLHDGHVDLYDKLMATEYNGNIQTGQPYTLDIYMGNTDRYDYVIEKCFYNSRLSFLDNYGCLRKDNVFQEKWETNQYTISGAIKRTLVYFIAPEPVARFECQIKVIECCGCAEQSCERQPIIIKEKTFVVPLMCSYPIGGGAFPYGSGGGYGGGYGGYWGQGNFWNVIPWWLWLLIFILFLILLCLIVCAICFCLMRRKGTRHRTYPPALPPPIAPKPQIRKNDEGVQAFPETKQKSQQVDLETEKRIEEEIRQRQLSRYDAVSLVDYPPKPEPKTVVHTIYSNEEVEFRDRRREHEHREFEEYGLDQEYVNLGPPSRSYHQSYEDDRRQDRRYGGVPLHRGASQYQQQQLQHEMEERLRQDENFRRELEQREFIERIENELSEHRERRHYAASPSGETLREETVRTLRQSSVI